MWGGRSIVMGVQGRLIDEYLAWQKLAVVAGPSSP